MKKKNVDPKKPKGTSGSAASLKRDSKGNLKAELKKDFGGVTAGTIKADREARSKSGDRSFTGAPAPKTGNVKLIKSGLPKGGSKEKLCISKC
jgi:hypothetical protein